MSKKQKKQEKRLRIIVNTNSPWAPSGYGQQARQFLPLMAKEGYPTACIGFYGLEGGLINLDGVTYYPKIDHPYGADAMIEHSNHFQADVVITLQDIWTLEPDRLAALAKAGKRWVVIVPIDHEPIPPAIFERLKLAYRIVSYSPFGYRELKRVGLHSTYIPHTVEDFMVPHDKKEVREELGIPEDMFVFGMVGVNKDNPPRKCFQQALDAFKRFHDKYPNSGLYMHCIPFQAGGFQLEEYARNLGIDKCLFFPPPYAYRFSITPQDMAKVYSAFDCLLSPSSNEGFGVPIIEAQACGVPAIVTDFTAMRDLVVDGETGFKISLAGKRFDGLGSYIAIPSTESLYECMEKVMKADRVVMGEKCKKFVDDNFRLEDVWKNNWVSFLEKLEKEVYDN